MRATVYAIVVALLVSFGAMAAMTQAPRTTGPPMALVGSASTGAYFDYFVIIVMENKNECEILTSCGGSANYMTNLANAYGLASQYHYCGVNPSLPNYLCLSGGSDFGCAGYDGNPNSNACTGQAWQAPNIVDRLETAGLTWKAYMEDMPSDCFASDAGGYIAHHNPFVYYSSNANDSARCARIVPAGASSVTLLDDLGSTTTASNYMWLTPNNCNNMHSCSIGVGDAYLADIVPKILNSTVFTTTRAALFITFDEDHGEAVYTVWAGPVAKTGYLSSYGYNHFSLLSTIEANWNLSSLTANDRDAPTMAEFFTGQPSRGVSVPPTGPVPLVLIVGIAAAVAVAIVVGILLLRRTRRKGGPPPKPDHSADGDDEDLRGL